jgi:PhoD-like phosphatase
VRNHEGPETVTPAGYRQRHAQYKSDPDLQAAHLAAPWLVVFDDHEVENNWADEVPEDGSDTPDTASSRARRAAAFQAYYENMPLRRSSVPKGFDISTHPSLTINPHLKFFNNQRGYVLSRMEQGHMTTDFKTLEFVRTPGAEVSTGGLRHRGPGAGPAADLPAAVHPRPLDPGGQVRRADHPRDGPAGDRPSLTGYGRQTTVRLTVAGITQVSRLPRRWSSIRRSSRDQRECCAIAHRYEMTVFRCHIGLMPDAQCSTETLCGSDPSSYEDAKR